MARRSYIVHNNIWSNDELVIQVNVKNHHWYRFIFCALTTDFILEDSYWIGNNVAQKSMSDHQVRVLNGFKHFLDFISIQSGGMTIFQRFGKSIEAFPVRYGTLTLTLNVNLNLTLTLILTLILIPTLTLTLTLTLILTLTLRYGQTTQQLDGNICGILVVAATMTEVMPPTAEDMKHARLSYEYLLKNKIREKILGDILIQGLFDDDDIPVNKEKIGHWYYADRKCSFCSISNSSVLVTSD